MQLSYWNILLFFILPPIFVIILLIGIRKRIAFVKNQYRHSFQLLIMVVIIHVLIALIYTTPWDNYLVANNIWFYDPSKISGIVLGYVPLEEYIFFIFQSLLTGFWTILIYISIPNKTNSFVPNPKYNLLAAILFLPALVSLFNLIGGSDNKQYLSLILIWAFFPIFLQWIFGLDILIKNIRLFLLSLIPVTLYLWIIDTIAITNGIWHINPDYILGISLSSLPMEEMVFFFVTNVIICSGIILMTDPESIIRVKSWIFSLNKRFKYQ